MVEDTWPSGQNGTLNPLRMDITIETGALFDNHPRLKNKALLLDITIVNPYAGSNLGNAARHVGKRLADAVARNKNKYRGSCPATYSLLPLTMSTCGDVGSDVHALIKELAIRRLQHRSETYSNESQHLAGGTEVARLRRRFSFVLQKALSFRTRHHLCRQGVALASTRQPHSQGPASVQAHVDENGDGDGSEDCSGDGNGDDNNGNGNEYRIGEGGREAKKRKKPQNSLDAVRETGETRVEREKKCRKERVGSVAAIPDNLESNKKAGGDTRYSGLM